MKMCNVTDLSATDTHINFHFRNVRICTSQSGCRPPWHFSRCDNKPWILRRIIPSSLLSLRLENVVVMMVMRVVVGGLHLRALQRQPRTAMLQRSQTVSPGFPCDGLAGLRRLWLLPQLRILQGSQWPCLLRPKSPAGRVQAARDYRPAQRHLRRGSSTIHDCCRGISSSLLGSAVTLLVMKRWC